jgi:diadenosine tetraphosphatase ApaH/serine/threonine PP2A family protein phosphatase
VITEESQFISPKECDYKWEIPAGKKFLFNLGSVGQPRDGDTRACYAVYHGDSVTWRRVEYDYKVTMQKIFNTPQLDPRAGERLANGR